MVQQPDGKLLVAGGSGCRPIVVRLTADGAVDPSFAFDGSWGVCTGARLIAAQDDGKVVIAGYDVIYGTWMVRRMLANGAPDPAFAGGGTFTRSPGLYSAVNALAVDAAGRVLLAGDMGSWSGGTEVGVMRVTADGRLDQTFGELGMWRARVMNYGTARSVAGGPSGTVLVGMKATAGARSCASRSPAHPTPRSPATGSHR